MMTNARRTDNGSSLRGKTPRLVAGVIALFLVCLIVPPAGAREGPNNQHAPALERKTKQQDPPPRREVEVKIDGVKVVVPDLMLRDQEDRKVRFYSDLIEGKVVVLTFFYTSCQFICGMQGAVLSELQHLLGERLGRSVFLISVTTDPDTDTPQQLRAWGERYHVGPGWTLVTGEKAEMNRLLVQFTGNPAGRGMHAAVTFIGNDRTGVWIGAGGVSAPDELLNLVGAIAQDGDGRLK